MPRDAVRAGIDGVIPYIPLRTLRDLSRDLDYPHARLEKLRGAALFVDAAGFTPLSHALGQTGARGLERLWQIFTDYYNLLIHIIREHGGVVYSFAGDSILACMSILPGEDDSLLARRAISCAIKIQKMMEAFSQVDVGAEKFTLQTKIGIGLGEYNYILLGKKSNWYVPAVVGRPVDQAILAENFAAGGDIVINGELWRLLPEEFQNGSVFGEDYYKLEHNIDWLQDFSSEDTLPEDIFTADFLKGCARFLNPVLYKKFITGYSDFVGAYRELTCLFVRYDCPRTESFDYEEFEVFNAYYQFIQECCAQYGGALIQTDLTDKGNMILILFGSPIALEDKETHAVRLALDLLAGKGKFPNVENVQMGITTDFGYSGDLGASFRKGYTVLGMVANIAARLATYKENEGILIDEGTQEKIREKFFTDEVKDVRLKGVPEGNSFFQVRSEVRRLKGVLEYNLENVNLHRNELERLLEFKRHAVEGRGQFCLIVGEPGIGKSRLTEAFLERVALEPVDILIGLSYAHERFTPFFPWKELLSLFFEIFDFEDDETKIKKIRKTLAGPGNLELDWAILLGEILGIKNDGPSPFADMSAAAKNLRLIYIITELIKWRSLSVPMLLFFDDAQWGDELSLFMIEDLAGNLKNHAVMILMVMRPGEAHNNVMRHKDLRLIELGQLNNEEARNFLRAKLPLAKGGEDLEELILRTAQGNPLYLDSISRSLKEQGHVMLGRDGKVRLVSKLSKIPIPESLHQVILSRIDSLGEDLQAVLKSASVIGRSFRLDLLRILLPTLKGARASGADIDKLDELIQELIGLDLIQFENETPRIYCFKTMVIQDVAYETMLVSTRTKLHLKLADYLKEKESRFFHESADILAYHYLSGFDEEAALDYCVLAALKAREVYANHDAIYHFKNAYEILLKPGFEYRESMLHRVTEELAFLHRLTGNYPESIKYYSKCLQRTKNPVKKALYSQGVGRALQESGETRRAVVKLESSLELLERTPPGRGIRLFRNIFLELFRSAKIKILPARTPDRTERRREVLDLQLQTISILTKIYYLEDVGKLLWSGLAGLNLAFEIQSPHYISRLYSIYGLVLMSVGFPGRARRYLKRSMEIAIETSDSKTIGLAFMYNGLWHFYRNEPADCISLEREAEKLLLECGEVWELLSVRGIIGSAYFASGRIRECAQIYSGVKDTAFKVNSQMHLGWAFAREAYCRYLTGTAPIDDIKSELRLSLEISLQARDFMNICAVLGQQAQIAIRENNPIEAGRLALEIIRLNKKYKIMMPTSKISLLDAVEAALFALSRDAEGISRRRLEECIRSGIKQAEKVARNYSYLRGPLFRVKAAFALYHGRKMHARNLIAQSITQLESDPNQMELGLTYYLASDIIVEKRENYLERARDIFEEFGLVSELRRFFREN